VDWHRQRLGRRQARFDGAVYKQAPNLLVGDDTDQVVDVYAPIAQGAALFVGFSDLRLEGDDPFETWLEVTHREPPLVSGQSRPSLALLINSCQH